MHNARLLQCAGSHMSLLSFESIELVASCNTLSTTSHTDPTILFASDGEITSKHKILHVDSTH